MSERVGTIIANIYSAFVRSRHSFEFAREFKGAAIWHPTDKKTREFFFEECDAFSIGEDIYVPYKTYAWRRKRLINHEYTHVEQQRRMGLLFPIAYWIEHARFGYENNRYEIAARRSESPYRLGPPCTF